MSTYTSEVSQASLLRQAVLNTSQSLELLREAVSNSVDADARNIDVRLSNVGGEMWDIVILDDGNGMEETHMKAFFNAGQSVKDFATEAIGEKGLGSKTTFVAKEICIESRRYSNPSAVLVGRMSNPLSSLRQGQIPQFTLETDPAGYNRGDAVGDHGRVRRTLLQSSRPAAGRVGARRVSGASTLRHWVAICRTR